MATLLTGSLGFIGTHLAVSLYEMYDCAQQFLLDHLRSLTASA